MFKIRGLHFLILKPIKVHISFQYCLGELHIFSQWSLCTHLLAIGICYSWIGNGKHVKHSSSWNHEHKVGSFHSFCFLFHMIKMSIIILKSWLIFSYLLCDVQCNFWKLKFLDYLSPINFNISKQIISFKFK